jgi:DNA-binding Lrp family transcriptional regulator
MSFSYEDLLILFYLEKNLREKFVDIAKIIGEPSAKVAKRYKNILHHGLIKDCRVEIYPIDPVSSMYLVLQLMLATEGALKKLISHLNELPYPITYQKVVGKHTLFLHTMIPAYEYFDFHNAFEILGRRQGIIHDIKFYVSSYPEFYNIKLYEAFSKEENKWMFSKEVMLQNLHRLIVDTRFKF